METLEIDRKNLSLPEDIAACHALIRELLSLIDSKDGDIMCLKQRLHGLLRDKFGRSTEKLSPGQLMLFAQELEQLLRPEGTEKSEPEAEAQKASKQSKSGKNGGGGRNRIAPSVPRERKDYLPAEADMICQCCGERKTEIGVEIVEQLDYVPASFKVIEHATHKFACASCQEGVVEGERPSQILNGGKVTEGVIAQISTARNADHLPLYRQSQIYAREGVDMACSSMGRWLDVSAQVAKPIYTRMNELILEGKVIQVDESPVNIIAKEREAKKVKKGYAWAYYGDDEHPYVFYDFQPDRTADRPKEILKGYANFLITDGYGGYEWYDPERSANCNVHLRRKIEQALNYDKKRAGMVLALYSELSKIEARIKGMTEEQILLTRQIESLPIMNQIKGLLDEWQPKVPPKTTLGIAINYGLARWEKLCRFTEHGFLRMDTNLVENSIRPIAIGRKNWLSIGAESALETSSIHASLVNTCKRLKINPFLYLRDIFIRLGRGNASIDELLPDRWKLENPINQIVDSAAITAVSII